MGALGPWDASGMTGVKCFGILVGDQGEGTVSPTSPRSERQILPRIDANERGSESENPQTVPFKMPIAPIKVKESSQGKYVSRIFKSGNP